MSLQDIEFSENINHSLCSIIDFIDESDYICETFHIWNKVKLIVYTLPNLTIYEFCFEVYFYVNSNIPLLFILNNNEIAGGQGEALYNAFLKKSSKDVLNKINKTIENYKESNTNES